MNPHKRFHCYDSQGKKIVRCFPINVIPENLEAHSAWTAGAGPITGAALEKLRAGVSKTRGRPKSPEHRAKMSAAARGRPKSAEHRAAMSRAHQARNALIREMQNAAKN